MPSPRLGLLLLAGVALHSQPSDLLTRARTRVLDTLSRLPRYTCTQTLSRDHFERTDPWPRCGGPPGTPRHISSDRLRLDVAITESGREIYSWAGAGSFASEHIRDLIPTGSIATGTFGPFLMDIFNNRGPTFTRDLDETLDGRTLTRFRYRVPQSASHYQFQAGSHQQMIAFDGYFWLDPDSAELVRLQVHSDSLPHQLGVCESTSTVSFHRAPIGEGEFLLPRSSRTESESLLAHDVNTIEYSACKQYHAESTVNFGPGDTQIRRPLPGAAGGGAAVPRGLHVMLVLETAIDTRTAAAGDVVAARVAKDVLEGRSKRVLIPAGTIVQGRITLLEHVVTGPPYFQVAILWNGRESGGAMQPFAATLDPKAGDMEDYVVSVKQLAAERRGAARTLPTRYPISAGRTLVFLSTEDDYVVPRGFVSEWVTVAVK